MLRRNGAPAINTGDQYSCIYVICPCDVSSILCIDSLQRQTAKKFFTSYVRHQQSEIEVECIIYVYFTVQERSVLRTVFL